MQLGAYLAIGIVVMMRLNGQAGGSQNGVDGRILPPVFHLMHVIQSPAAQAEEAHQQHNGGDAIQRSGLSKSPCSFASTCWGYPSFWVSRTSFNARSKRTFFPIFRGRTPPSAPLSGIMIS